MADDDHDGWLPEDIFPFIEDLKRRSQAAWLLCKRVVFVKVIKRFGPRPGRSFTAEDLTQEVMLELLKPSTLNGFNGIGDAGALQQPDPTIPDTITLADTQAAHEDGGDEGEDSGDDDSNTDRDDESEDQPPEPAREAPSPRARFEKFLKTIIWRTRRRMDHQDGRGFGEAPPSPTPLPTGTTPADSPTYEPVFDLIPISTQPLDIDALPLPASDPPILDQLIARELLDEVLDCAEQLHQSGKASNIQRVEWLRQSAQAEEELSAIAQRYGVKRDKVRDGLHDLRETYLFPIREAYDADVVSQDLPPPSSSSRHRAAPRPILPRRRDAPKRSAPPQANVQRDSVREILRESSADQGDMKSGESQ